MVKHSRSLIKRVNRIENKNQIAVKGRTELQQLQYDNFYEFFLGTWDVLHPSSELDVNWHLRYIAELLQLVYQGEIKKLSINIQPRFLKSELVSVAYPCWVWLHSPGEKFLCLSYSSALANTHNQMRRDLLRSNFYKNLFPELQLREDKNRISEFGNNFRGEIVARGYDGSITGVGSTSKGGIINDDANDPIKAESGRVRSETLRKFKDYSISRRSDPKNTPIINIQQRAHVEDITGYIESELSSEYKIIKLPSRAIENEEIVSPLSGELLATRKIGELLHPSRFGEEEDAEALRTMGAYMYASRFQQQPYVQGGGIFSNNWWRYTDVIPNNCIAVISVDASFGSVTETASFVVMQLWLIKRPNFIIYDQFRERLTYPETEAKLKEYRLKWMHELEMPITSMLIEKKANGAAIIQTLRAEFPGIIEINPTESKKARAESVAPNYESGNVLQWSGGAFKAIFELEHENFPNHSTNDCVDGASQVINYYIKRWRFNDLNINVRDEGITGSIKSY